MAVTSSQQLHACHQPRTLEGRNRPNILFALLFSHRFVNDRCITVMRQVYDNRIFSIERNGGVEKDQRVISVHEKCIPADIAISFAVYNRHSSSTMYAQDPIRVQVLKLVVRRRGLSKFASGIVAECFCDLFTRVHDKGAVLNNRFVQRLTSKHNKSGLAF